MNTNTTFIIGYTNWILQVRKHFSLLVLLSRELGRFILRCFPFSHSFFGQSYIFFVWILFRLWRLFLFPTIIFTNHYKFGRICRWPMVESGWSWCIYCCASWSFNGILYCQPVSFWSSYMMWELGHHFTAVLYLSPGVVLMLVEGGTDHSLLPYFVACLMSASWFYSLSSLFRYLHETIQWSHSHSLLMWFNIISMLMIHSYIFQSQAGQVSLSRSCPSVWRLCRFGIIYNQSKKTKKLWAFWPLKSRDDLFLTLNGLFFPTKTHWVIPGSSLAHSSCLMSRWQLRSPLHSFFWCA